MGDKRPDYLKSGKRGLNSGNIFKTIQAELNTTQVGVQNSVTFIILMPALCFSYIFVEQSITWPRGTGSCWCLWLRYICTA